MATGIEARHRTSCASRDGARCNCQPSYRASVWSRRERKRISKAFPTEAAAKQWRADAQGAVRRGTMRAPSPTTVREAAEEWLAGARDGSIRSRSGDEYKPSTIRGYAEALRLKLLPSLGARRLCDLTAMDVQDVVDRLLANGCQPSTLAERGDAASGHCASRGGTRLPRREPNPGARAPGCPWGP
jgi:integrase